jgi:spore germination protein YaaH
MNTVCGLRRLWVVGLVGLAAVGAPAQETWDETGPDWPVPEIPDVSEVSPAIARARSLAKTTALELGATEAEAEQAAFLVPEYLEQWKSPHQLAFEEHQGEAPTDFDPNARPTRIPKTTEPILLPKAAPKGIAPGKRVLGWHPYWATMTDIQNYQYTNLTTIAYFSYAVNSTNGNYDSIGSWKTSPVVEWAHSNNVKVVLTATLFGDAATHRFLTNSVACSNLITQLLIAMTNRTLPGDGDGVNIDFEGVGSWTGATAAMTSFMSNLTTRFKAANPNYEISIALPSVDWYANFAVSNYAAFGMDYAIIMGYDYYYSGSGTPGPVAPLTSSAQWIGASSWCSVNYSMNYYLGKGIPATKLMLGVPYYGRRWAAASTNLGAASLGSSYSAALTYGACESEAANYGKKWDSNGSVPYYVYTSNSTAYQCFYDDTASLGMKYDLSNSKGMGGIGIWNLTQGTSQTALWELIDEKFGADAAPPPDPDPGDMGGSSATAPWVARTSAHAGNFYGVASRAGLHVASGAGGAIYTSTNGINWTARSSGKSGLLMNVNGDGPLWVVVGEGGAIVTSPDGTNWTARTSPTNALFRGVAYGNGVYVACGDNGALVRSTNGTTWTAVSSSTTLSLQGVGYGMDYVNMGDTNGIPAEYPLFVVTGANGLLLTSSDGLAWTARSLSPPVYVSDAMYGNGYYVAVGKTNIFRSVDGIAWSVIPNSSYLMRAGYCAGMFKAVGTLGAIWSSTDGANWEPETSGTTNDIRGISYVDDQFVAVGFNGTILTKGTMGAVEEGGGEEGGEGGETGGGDEPLPTPDETGLPQVAAAQPTGPLSGVVVYTSAGHGFGANEALTAWVPERPLLYAVNEDMGNVDQMNRFAEAAWKAGATVVPIRPLGYQTNEVVLDNMNTTLTSTGQVTFGGTWYNSSQTIFYGKAGDAVPYRYAAVSTNGSTSWASYRPNLPEAGQYPVYTWVRHGSDRANQLYRVYHSGGVTDVRVNHRDVGCGWVWLGNYHFEKGTNGYVNIGNHVLAGDTGDYVFADAIRFGNGRGNVERGGAGISGFEQELESGRFWVIKSMGQGMSSTLYDLAGYDDRSDNIGQPARMAAWMCRSNDAPRWRRVYVGFHSNAGSGTSRGAIGLYDTRIQSGYPALYKAQTNLAAALARQCNVDMRAGAASGVIPSWSTRTSYLYGSTYGEIYNSSVFLKMDTTINEVAFHDNADDCAVLKLPAGREWLARATARGLIKHINGYYTNVIVNTNAPDRPVNLKAVNSGSGQVTVSWAMPTRDAASGGLPTGFILYTSTDGQGFANPIAISGGGTTSKAITNLNAGATIFFKVCATNAGGESFDSAVAGVRVTANGAKAGVLVVDGFKRNDAGLAPTRYFANGLNGQVTLVRPRMINGFDYVKEHGLALAAAGQTFDYADSTQVTAALLTNYSKVVWMLGEESTVDETFSSAEQAAVTNYLGKGGRLFVSGAEIGWDLVATTNATTADKQFFTNVLRAVYAADSGGTGQVTGTAGGFLSGVSIGFNYTNLLSDIYAANWPDVLRTGSGAVTAAVYGASSSGTSGAIIQYSNSTYRTIVMGFPFETITNETTRATVMTKAMQFLSDSAVPGAIRVTLSPTAVTNAARWIVNGTTNTSGSTRTGLNAGTYQVTFLPVAGYTAPAATSIVVTAGATNVFTATYEAMATGSLTVTLEPTSAVADGRWSVDGGGTWRTSGSTLSGMSNGTYTLTFKDVASHTTPTDQSVEISAGGAVTRTGTYVALVGDLTVTLSPVAVRSLGAAWSVDGGATWHASGATASNLLAGRQYYTFKPVTGYTPPSTTYALIEPNSNNTRTCSYTALPGSITVTLGPADAIAAGAMWSLDGGATWNESGATVQDLSAKNYTITYSAVAGYVTPTATSYSLAAGEAASLSQTYEEIQLVGADCIKSQGFDGLDVHPWGWSVVYLDNSAIATGAAGGSGAAVATNKVLAGTNALRMWGSTNGMANPAVVFDNVDISGYTNVTLTIPFAAHGPDSGDDLHVSVSYDGGTTWTPSIWGTQIADGYNNLSMDYDVFIDAERQPQGRPYELAIADSRTQIMVRVTFFNAAGSANAGDYYYLDEVQLKGDEGTAPVISSALKVTLAPAEAASAGAQWRVDAGAWRNSGTTATGLTAGAHTVSFSAVSGWTAPADVSTATTNSTTNSFTVTYVEQSSGPVTIFEDGFEDGDLAGWTQDGAGNWTNSTTTPITGNRSLKHNLSSVATTNYVYAQPSYNLAADTTTWRFKLKNGWDPSGSSRFHIFLAASDSNFAGSAVDGYVVGVNLTGTDDLLNLCRIENGAYAATVVASAVAWDANMCVAVEVTRTTAGVWELKTSTAGVFSGMTSAGTASDTTYTDTAYFGLYVRCAPTYAGKLWLDDELIHQGELPGVTDSDGDGMPDDYENEHFNSPTGGDPDADDDEDGMSNLAEYVAGTHPGQGTSVLAFDPLVTNQTATANLIFRWPSVSGRVYAILRATNAMGPYTQHIGGIVADTPTNTVTNAAPTGLGTYYYGLKVSLPEVP